MAIQVTEALAAHPTPEAARFLMPRINPSPRLLGRAVQGLRHQATRPASGDRPSSTSADLPTAGGCRIEELRWAWPQ